MLQGVLRVGDRVEIRPGHIAKDKVTGKQISRPIKTRITSLQAEKNELLYAVPGGLIAIGLQVDPTTTRADKLSGMILGHPDQLPDVVNQVKVDFHLLQNLIGVKGDASQKRVQSLKKDETLLINIAANTVPGKVIKSKKREATIEFTKPVCAAVGDKMTLSRKITNTYRLIGWGEMKEGVLA